MHGHTGATMSIHGEWVGISADPGSRNWLRRAQQKVRLSAVYNILPQILWMKKFLEDQGVTIKETVLYQDNMSSMLLEQNGRQSSTENE